MKYYQCECGSYQSYTSMGVDECAYCDKCNTSPSMGPTGHRTIRTPHRLYIEMVNTDKGKQPLSVCIWCNQTKEEIQSKNEPYETEGVM